MINGMRSAGVMRPGVPQGLTQDDNSVHARLAL
jgi:hypothetical protein